MPATLTYTLGRFVWREHFTHDVAKAKAFYGELFGWGFEDRPMGPEFTYTIVTLGGKQIGGMMALGDLPGGAGAMVPPHWAVYVSVDDVDAAAKRAVAEGGQIMGECHDIPGVGRFAVCEDPTGAMINLYRDLNGDGPEGPVDVGAFCWENLSTSDIAKSLAFYEKVVGWKGVTFAPGVSVFNRDVEGKPVGVASVGQAYEGTPSNWGTFVKVDDVDASLAKAQGLGATMLVPVTEIPGTGHFCVIMDPGQAAIFMFKPAPQA